MDLVRKEFVATAEQLGALQKLKSEAAARAVVDAEQVFAFARLWVLITLGVCVALAQQVSALVLGHGTIAFP